MAAALRWGLYDAKGLLIARCRRAEEAAAVVALLGNGAIIRDGYLNGEPVWVEGAEQQPADESYDFVAQVIAARGKGIGRQ